VSGLAYDSPLDAGIARFVEILASYGVETYESCEGGPGHCSAEPFVKFHGNDGAGWAALSIAKSHGMPVAKLVREWALIDGEVTGPTWRMTFYAWANGERRALWWFAPPPSHQEQS
jgi:hypothetical protein